MARFECHGSVHILFREFVVNCIGARNVRTGRSRIRVYSGFNDNPFHRYLACRLLNNAQITGACVYSAMIRPTGIGGSVHGGVIATMIDMAVVVSVFSNLPDTGSPAGTADLAVTTAQALAIG